MFSKVPLIQRHTLEMSDEQQERLCHFIREEKRKMREDKQQWMERQSKYLSNYDDFVTWVRKGPWEGCSNVKVPFTDIMAKSYHARLYNTFSSDDIYSITGVDPSDEISLVYAKLFKYYIHKHLNEYEGIEPVINELCLDVAKVGFGVIFKDYQLKQRKSLVIDENELIKEMLQLEGEIKDKGKADVSPYKQVEKIITTYDGNILSTVPYENILFPNFIPRNSNLNYPRLVWIDVEMSESELNLGVKQGRFTKDGVEAVLARGHAPTNSNTEQRATKDKKGRLSGYASTHETIHTDTYPMGYAMVTFDIDDDGIDEELFLTMSDYEDVVGGMYLDQFSRSGKRPVYKFDCFAKARQAYATGVPEKIYSIQTQLDINYNLRNDCLQLQAYPWGVYRATSSLKAETINIGPGVFVPVDEVSDLRPMGFPTSALGLVGEENILQQWGQQQLSINPASQGFIGPTVGAQRSTSGIAALVGQVEKEFAPTAMNFARSFKMLLQDLMFDMELISTDTKKRIVGHQYASQIANADFFNVSRLKYDIEINVANIKNSIEMRRNNAFMLLQTLQNPSIAQQFGVVNARGIYNAYKEWLSTYDYLDFNSFISEPPVDENPYDLNGEIESIYQGKVPPMSMRDNHMEKAQGLLMFIQTPLYQEAKQLGRTVPEVDEIMNRTIVKHQELAQALMAKQMNPYGITGQDQNAVMVGQGENQGATNEGMAGGSQGAIQDEGMVEPNRAGAENLG